METPNEVAHQGVIPNHHFAVASSECIKLYRDGCLLSAVMVSQSVTEGIWRFVLERNQIQLKELKGGERKINRPAIGEYSSSGRSSRLSALPRSSEYGAAFGMTCTT